MTDDLVVALVLHRYLRKRLADKTFLAEHTTGRDELKARAEEWTIERAAHEAGLDAEDLQWVADLYATTSPAVIRCGSGPERNRNGGHAVLAVLAPPAVDGKFGVRGGGYSTSNSAAFGFNNSCWLDVPEPAARIVNMNHLGRALTPSTAIRPLSTRSSQRTVSVGPDPTSQRKDHQLDAWRAANAHGGAVHAPRGRGGAQPVTRRRRARAQRPGRGALPAARERRHRGRR